MFLIVLTFLLILRSCSLKGYTAVSHFLILTKSTNFTQLFLASFGASNYKPVNITRLLKPRQQNSDCWVGNLALISTIEKIRKQTFSSDHGIKKSVLLLFPGKDQNA